MLVNMSPLVVSTLPNCFGLLLSTSVAVVILNTNIVIVVFLQSSDNEGVKIFIFGFKQLKKKFREMTKVMKNGRDRKGDGECCCGLIYQQFDSLIITAMTRLRQHCV